MQALVPKFRAALLPTLAAWALAQPALAHVEVYQATLNGASESPANGSAGTGTATVTFDLDLYTMRVVATFSGLTGTTTNAHIHCCTATSGLGGDAAANLAGTAGVATITPTFTGFPSGVTSGAYDRSFDMLQLGSYNATFVAAHGGTNNSDADKAAASFSALLAGVQAGQAYLNIHSSFRAGGEIRGFLAPVPEPQAWALMLAGLAVTGWAGQRRARR